MTLSINTLDPCAVFPPEILHKIFKYLDLKERSLFQSVSRSWRLFLSDPHLWASSIDFRRVSRTWDKKCDQKILKQCLDRALLNSEVRTIEFLRVGPFTNDSSQIECLKMLGNLEFPHPGRSVDEIEITIKDAKKDLVDHLIYNLLSTRKLSITFETGSLDLGCILSNQKDTLEVLILNSSALTWGKHSLPDDTFPKYPLIRTLDLEFYSFSASAILHLFSECPGLTALRLTSELSLDISWLCKASRVTMLELLAVEHKFDGWFSIDSSNVFSDYDTPVLTGVSRWPRLLKSLSLRGVEWLNLKIVSGTLEGLQSLDLTGSKINVVELFSRFNCGKNLKRLELRFTLIPGRLDNIIWKKCPKLQWLSVFDAGIDDSQINQILTHCHRLKVIDVGGNAEVTESAITKLAEGGIKRIGCYDVCISSRTRKKLGTILDDRVRFS